MIELQDGESAKVTNDGGVTKIEEVGAEPPPPPPPQTPGVVVDDFGAKGDGVTDDSDAIQRALDAGVNTRVLFPRRGPYKVTRTMLIKGNCTVEGWGGARLECHGRGGLGVAENVGGLQYLRVEGFEIANQSGDKNHISLGTNELNDRGFPMGPNVPIDICIFCRNKIIRGKVLLCSKPGRMWFLESLIESTNQELNPYALGLDMGNGSTHRPGSNDSNENGAWICNNNIRVLCALPDSHGGDSDIVKMTGTLARVHFTGNKVVNLDPDRIEAQIDAFTGGGQITFAHNDLHDVCLHYKQHGEHPGMQHIQAWAGGIITKNHWRWRSAVAGFHHIPLFVRAGGGLQVEGNWFNIDCAGKACDAMVFDNAAPDEDTGWGSGSPCFVNVSGNIAWLQRRQDHRLMQIQGSGIGPPRAWVVHGNIVHDPSGQSKATAELRAAHKLTMGMNVSPNSPAWQLGPDSKDAGGNIFG